jgi:hypothetical protein
VRSCITPHFTFGLSKIPQSNTKPFWFVSLASAKETRGLTDGVCPLHVISRGWELRASFMYQQLEAMKDNLHRDWSSRGWNGNFTTKCEDCRCRQVTEGCLLNLIFSFQPKLLFAANHWVHFQPQNCGGSTTPWNYSWAAKFACHSCALIGMSRFSPGASNISPRLEGSPLTQIYQRL